jgi:hypothetical protein
VRRLHVIPVPRGYEPLDAWWEIQTFGRLKLPWWRRFWTRRSWAIIEVEEET